MKNLFEDFSSITDALAPPSFTQGGLQDLRLKVGETIKYDVPISGEPLPTASWTVNRKPLKAQGRVKMTTERGKTILKIENAVRADSGQFTLTLKNKSGIAESSAKVTVVGRPTAPKGKYCRVFFLKNIPIQLYSLTAMYYTYNFIL